MTRYVVILIAIIASGCAVTPSLEEADQAYDSGNYQRALEYYKAIEEAESEAFVHPGLVESRAAWRVANILYKGKGIPEPRFDEAAPYFAKSRRWIQENDRLTFELEAIIEAYTQGETRHLQKAFVVSHPRYSRDDNEWRRQAANYWASKALDQPGLDDEERSWIAQIQKALNAPTEVPGAKFYYAYAARSLDEYGGAYNYGAYFTVMRHYWRWQAARNGHERSRDVLSDLTSDLVISDVLSRDQQDEIEQEIARVQESRESRQTDTTAETCKAFYGIPCDKLLEDFANSGLVRDAGWNAPIPVVIDLIDSGANVQQVTDDRMTLLHIAAYRRSAELARAVINAGVPVDAEWGRHDWTALHIAVAPPEARTGAVTVAASSEEAADKDLVELLLDSGAAATKRDNKGRPPVVMTAREDIIDLLERHGADPGQRRYYAATSGSVQTGWPLADYAEIVEKSSGNHRASAAIEAARLLIERWGIDADAETLAESGVDWWERTRSAADIRKYLSIAVEEQHPETVMATFQWWDKVLSEFAANDSLVGADALGAIVETFGAYVGYAEICGVEEEARQKYEQFSAIVLERYKLERTTIDQYGKRSTRVYEDLDRYFQPTFRQGASNFDRWRGACDEDALALAEKTVNRAIRAWQPD